MPVAHEALQLFIDGFVPAGGFRLLRVARPAVLNYGLYGPARVSAAELRLIDLVNRRGALARQLDCLTECACEPDAVFGQIVLDKLLYDIDRAIDFVSRIETTLEAKAKVDRRRNIAAERVARLSSNS